MKKLYLHIGSHKTGTSSIQKSLFDSRQLLTRNGFSYFCEDISGRPDSNTSGWLKYDKKNFMEGKGAKVANIEKLFEKLSTLDGDVIMSAENFSWIFEEDEINRIHKETQKYFDKVVVVIYIRRQDKLAVSHHQQGSGDRNGRKMPSSFFYGHENQALPLDNHLVRKYLDYNKKISMWARFFGNENMLIRIFEEQHLVGNDAVSDFFSILNIHEGFEKYRANESKGFELTKIGHLLIQNNMPIGFLNRMIRRNCNNEGKCLPSRMDAIHFYNYYINSNIELNNIFNITENNAAIFDSDFSSYPEKPEDEWDEESANAAITNIFHAIQPLTQLRIDDLQLAGHALKSSNVDAGKRLLNLVNILKKFETKREKDTKSNSHGGAIREHSESKKIS